MESAGQQGIAHLKFRRALLNGRTDMHHHCKNRSLSQAFKCRWWMVNEQVEDEHNATDAAKTAEQDRRREKG